MKVLVLVLTSSKIKLLKRCVESVLNQRKVSFEYDIKIIVNTLNDNYYGEVLEKIKYEEVEILRTESNGFPGMGHNSCLKTFQELEEYTHCSFIDGDDLLYPVAFQQYEKMLNKEPELDLLHLMLNDRVHFDNKDNFNYLPLKFNYKLISSFTETENWWAKMKTKSPLINQVKDTKTPSRILLVSRKIFKTTLPIRYSEDLTLYDDFVTFFAFYEAQLRGEINTFSTSDTNIYLYNSLNDHSASYNFKEKEREDKLFRKEISIYTKAINHNWKISELPFIKVDQPEDFTTNDKIPFCNKHIVDFEISEKFNQLKELKEISKDNLEELKKVEYLFLFLVKGGFDTVNNTLKLAEINFMKKDINGGITLLMRLCQKSPNSGLYKKIFEVLFNYKLYNKCEYYYELIKSCDALDENINKKYEVILKNRNVVGDNIFYKNGRLTLNLDSTKELFCYFTGYTDDFDGSNYGEKSVYGSEISAIKLGEKLTDKYNVIVLCSGEKLVRHNGVYYMGHTLYQELVNNYEIDHLVISRFIGGVLDMDLSNVENIYYIMHDTRSHDLWFDKTLPLLSLYLFKNMVSKMKNIICVSKWQKENFQNVLKMAEIEIPENKYKILGNGINTEKFKYKKVQKKNNRFVSCSDPSRGLLITCEILVELQKKYEDITLDIYFGSLPEDIKQYVNKYSFINYHGKISNDQMVIEFSKSDFWLYPNVNSHETFCISCVEAQCGGNVVITRDFSALPELVKDTGILIPRELEGESLKKYTIEKIEYVLDNNLKESYQEKAHKSSLKYDWSNVAKQWYSFLNNTK